MTLFSKASWCYFMTIATVLGYIVYCIVNCHSWISCCTRTNVFFLVLLAYASVLVLVLRVNVLVLVLVLRVTVSVLVLVLAHTVLLTSRGFDNLTTASGKVQYKFCTLMHSIRNSRCPVYLSDTVQAASAMQIASAYGRLSPLTSSYLNSGLNLESLHSRTLAQLPGTIFHKIFTASQNSPSSRNTWKAISSLQHTKSLDFCFILTLMSWGVVAQSVDRATSDL